MLFSLFLSLLFVLGSPRVLFLSCFVPLLPPFGLHSFDLGLGLGGRAVQPVPRAVLPLVLGCAVPRVSVRCLGGSTAQSHGNPRPVLPVVAVRYYRYLPGTGSAASIHRSVPDERYNRSPKRFYRGMRTGLYILDGAEGLSFFPSSSFLFSLP